MTAGNSAQAEFAALSDALKRFPGEHFEEHQHPAVVLDQATSAAVRVWGWWTTADPKRPCLLWCSNRGWFATVVEPEESGTPGYELAHWTHRIRLLDLALANAIGPHPSLGLLELHLVLSPHQAANRDALLWGIVHLRAAHHRVGRSAPPQKEDPRTAAGRVDRELVLHSLGPTLFKKRTSGPPWLTSHYLGIGVRAPLPAMLGPSRRSPLG